MYKNNIPERIRKIRIDYEAQKNLEETSNKLIIVSNTKIINNNIIEINNRFDEDSFNQSGIL